MDLIFTVLGDEPVIWLINFKKNFYFFLKLV
jgi:hypothetical protein